MPLPIHSKAETDETGQEIDIESRDDEVIDYAMLFSLAMRRGICYIRGRDSRDERCNNATLLMSYGSLFVNALTPALLKS